jgi:hypothetical protein
LAVGHGRGQANVVIALIYQDDSELLSDAAFVGVIGMDLQLERVRTVLERWGEWGHGEDEKR